VSISDCLTVAESAVRVSVLRGSAEVTSSTCQTLDVLEVRDFDLVRGNARPSVTQIVSEVGFEFLPALKSRRQWKAAYHCSCSHISRGENHLTGIGRLVPDQALDAGGLIAYGLTIVKRVGTAIRLVDIAARSFHNPIATRMG
jgi:hypothetical protein